MTVREWAEKISGVIVKIPQGTHCGQDWWYWEDGEWTRTPKAWRTGMTKEPRQRYTTQDQFVEITITPDDLAYQALKALNSRSGRSADGALIVKRHGGGPK